MNLHELKNLLLTVGPPVSHYHAHQQPDKYIVWAEYGTDEQVADNEDAEKSFRVQVDYFTKTEFDPNVETIGSLLDTNESKFSYLVDFETDTGYIHHIWDGWVA